MDRLALHPMTSHRHHHCHFQRQNRFHHLSRIQNPSQLQNILDDLAMLLQNLCHTIFPGHLSDYYQTRRYRQCHWNTENHLGILRRKKFRFHCHLPIQTHIVSFAFEKLNVIFKYIIRIFVRQYLLTHLYFQWDFLTIRYFFCIQFTHDQMTKLCFKFHCFVDFSEYRLLDQMTVIYTT